ncbi:MAG: signal peptidase II [Anaerovoracaceae bacterium]
MCPVVFMYYIVIIAVVLIDQIIKIMVRGQMELFESYPLLGDFFSFTYIENYGAAFSMFSGQRFVLLAIPTAVVVLGIYYLMINKNKKDKIMLYSVALLIGGGLGNLIDRFIFGSVTDYFDLKSFAIFNFADICVCVGCFLICIYVIFLEGRKEREK